MARHPIVVALAWLLTGGVLLALLSRGLPAQSFFVGDCGIKLVAARAALQRPLPPIVVPAPRIGAALALDYADPFAVPHGDHTHVLTPDLFALISAPFVSLAGIRGAYVWPGIAFLALPLLVVGLARAMGCQNLGWPAVVLLLGCSPVLFYCLEIWEHAPAVATLAAAMLLLAKNEGDAQRASAREWLAGVWLGFGYALRPEMLFMALGLALFFSRSGFAPRARLVGGFVLFNAPLIAANLVHFGSPFAPHLSANTATALREWQTLRGPVVAQWLGVGPDWSARLGLLVVLAAATLSWLLWRRAPVRFSLRAVAIAGAVVVAVAAVRRDVPREGLWAVFPFALLALLPESDASSRWPGRLRGLAILFIASTWLTTSNLGGGQWGPRYLLPVCLPLSVLVALVVRDALREAGWRRVVNVALLAPLAVASLWIQRDSYRGALRATKRDYAQIVEGLRAQTRTVHYVVTDLWWLGQIAADLQPEVTFLHVKTTDQAQQAVQQLAAADAPQFVVARSSEESRAGETANWLTGTCYAATPTASVPVRRLELSVASCGRR